jgi:hypothetical protein
MNNGAPVNLLARPELPELSVNGSSPHIDDQPPEPPADPDGYPMKNYHVEVTLETGEWTDGWAGGRCEDAELIAGNITLCLGVEAHTKEEALTKAVTAARTAIHHAGTATLRFRSTQLKPLANGDDESRMQLLDDRKPPYHGLCSRPPSSNGIGPSSNGVGATNGIGARRTSRTCRGGLPVMSTAPNAGL